MPIDIFPAVCRPARRVLLSLLPLAILAACTDARPEETVLVRLISSGPEAAQRLDPRTDLLLRPTWQRKIDGPADLSAWSFYVPSSAATLATPEGGIDLGPLQASRYLVWTGSLSSASVDVLRFHFREPLAGQVELYWNGPGEDFAPQRYLLQSPDPRDPNQVVFDPGTSHHWLGTVARIGIRLLSPPPAGQALLQVEGLRYVAPEGMGHGETRSVELDGRSMQAWLQRPGNTLHHRLKVPRGAHLRFDAAPWLPDGGGVRIRVVAQGPRGRRTLVDRELRQREDPPRSCWDGVEADLREFTGETIDLLFETAPASPGSLVMWGNPRLVGASGDSRPNVVLISLDTVRADHLSLYGYRRPTTPNLAAWARRQATVFETTVASAPWTLPSHVSMLSGIDAVHHGVNRHGPIPASMVLLPQRFRDAGYTTYATTAGVLLTPELGFARGFDELRVRGKMESLPEWDTELSQGVTETLRWLAAHRDERFFLFFHTFEAHAPYQPREPYFSSFGGSQVALNAGSPVWMETPEFEANFRPKSLLFHPPAYAGGVTYPKRVLEPRDRELAATLYDSGLAYIDQQLSRLLGYLESEGLMENTVVVVTSDHGESLYEHGLVGHSSLYDHDLLVPLIISTPLGSAHGRRVGAQVRSIDIAPTLAELAGLAPLGAIDGSSLVPFLRGEAAAPRDAWSYALSTGRGVSLRTAQNPRKLIAQDTVFDPFRGTLEIYDLRRDPGEMRNLSSTASDMGSRTLRQRLVREVAASGAAIQIRVMNVGPGEFSGAVRGDAIDAMVTSADLSFSCCVATPTGVHFHAPPGADFTLVLQDRPASILRLELTAAGEPWKGALPPGTTPVRLRVAQEGGHWQTTAAETHTRRTWTGVEIRRPGSEEATPANEEQLRDKLRALGYIR
jgi:arylsulfatase A-like enzyme